MRENQKSPGSSRGRIYCVRLASGLLGRGGRVQPLHQAALAAGGIVAVDHAFGRGIVEGADGLERRRADILGRGLARRADGRAGAGADDLVADALTVIRPDALESRSSVSQSNFS